MWRETTPWIHDKIPEVLKTAKRQQEKKSRKNHVTHSGENCWSICPLFCIVWRCYNNGYVATATERACSLQPYCLEKCQAFYISVVDSSLKNSQIYTQLFFRKMPGFLHTSCLIVIWTYKFTPKYFDKASPRPCNIWHCKKAFNYSPLQSWKFYQHVCWNWRFRVRIKSKI